MELQQSPRKSRPESLKGKDGVGNICQSPTAGSDSSRHTGCLRDGTVACPSAPCSQGGTPSPSLTEPLSISWVRRGTVRKSKTHDCVAGMGLRAGRGRTRRALGSIPTGDGAHHLVGSASFSGFGVSSGSRSRLLRENRSASGSREIIDYRNLTPQVPFVPSIAKSIPKKRISLRKPKRAIRDFLGVKRRGREKPVSPCLLSPGGGEQTTPSPGRGRQEGMFSVCSGAHEHSDDLSDSSVELCSSMCEDMASLRSFGSHTGCGEIFAYEEHRLPVLTPTETGQRRDPNNDICEPRKASPVVGSFQGGVEQMASPAHAEILDILGLWGTLTSTETKELKNAAQINPSLSKSASQYSLPSPEVISEPKNVELLDKGTPKSDKQEIFSTSDEGYYEYISPGLEDSSRGSVTPHLSSHFPRDSYSGDALYELFYDPSENKMTPIIDEDIGLSESVLGQAGDHPLSMYSFHVGAEENLAPPLAVDFVSQELLQSSWKGKECLLKLCDTEISLAMGIMNWLKQKGHRSSPPGTLCHGVDVGKCTISADRNDIHNEGEDPPKKHLTVEECDPEKPAANKAAVCQQGVGKFENDVPSKLQKEGRVSTSAECADHVESEIRTPTSGFYFRIFNKDSPLTPNRDLRSPMLKSPGSTTSRVFLLAINRESLCDSCKRLLKQGSKELYLCASCVTFVEHIKTSDLLSPRSIQRTGTPGTPRTLLRGLLDSPTSPCRTDSDITLVRLLEQCVGQMSCLKINGNHVNVGQDTQPPLTQLEEGKQDTRERDVKVRKCKEQTHKFLKSEHMTKVSRHGSSSDAGGLAALMLQDSQSHDAPSLLEAGGLGLVTNDGSDGLALEAYHSPCSDTRSQQVVHSPSMAQAPRPTYLPLSNSAYSEFNISQAPKTRARDRLRKHKKSSVNRDGPCGYVLPDEKKADRKHRLKK